MPKNVAAYVSRMTPEISLRDAMNRIPSTNWRPECPTASGMSAAVGGAKPAITRAMAMKPSEEAANTTHVSEIAMTSPPRAGKNILVPCQSMELRATALIMCSRAMRLGKNACRLGKSIPAMSAITAAMTRTCQTATTPLPSRAARSASNPAIRTEVTMSIRRRSTRSAMTPPTRVAAIVGIDEAAPSSPS